MKNYRGAMLLELLLMIAIIGTIFPILYRQNVERNHRAQDVAIVREMQMIQAALDQYIEDKEPQLIGTPGGAVYQVKLADLHNYGLTKQINNENNKYGIQYSLRLIKTTDAKGRSFVQGLVVANNPNFSPLRTRQISLAVGERGGYAEQKQLYGSYGTWQQSSHLWNVNISENAVLMNTQLKSQKTDSLLRIASVNRSENTMDTDMDMNQHDIMDLGKLEPEVANFTEQVTAKNLNANVAEFSRFMTITKGLSIKNDAYVRGNLGLENQNIVLSRGLVLQKDAYFKQVNTGVLRTNTLNLFTINAVGGVKSELGVNQHLSINNGQVRAGSVMVGYTGSIASRIVVSDEIRPYEGSQYFWNLKTKEAVMQSLALSNLSQMMVDAVNAENPGTAAITDTETRLKSATSVSMVIGILEEMRGAVESKYSGLKLVK